ncbi:UDP-glucose--hexose-1-phosphate uridylyltransferase [Bacillus weihaiensis]|uniref:UDP-glucose--hexose-1-phosphate uridylyltransferase n=1 Tax=Bacillus weihaiensis TaxID=1547283 RepID=UPI002353B6B5|nr:UDP-glucose--hexose-1-phosphate uridylyltransferase [Bacillus weihaiensis]
MTEVISTIQQLVQKAIDAQLISSLDELYSRNQLMEIFKLVDFKEEASLEQEQTLDIPDLVEKLVDYAVEMELIPDILDEREIVASKIMNVFIPRPSDVNATFYDNYKASPKKATEYFYKLSQDSNYIQTKRIAKNISYKVDTKYGELDITINLSKPEKDPKQIALEKEMKKPTSHYPKCLLCVENEGYAGRIGHPARSNHRVIRMELGKEEWALQYSPYVYYNEHCILLSTEHRDMKISKEGFERLIEFVEKFPHYFIGSNADLPIVGGSILTHDHYQGGNYEFAMAKAKEEILFSINEFPEVRAATVKWPMSVIRLKGTNKEQLVAAATKVLDIWKEYSDPKVEIEASSGEIPHNTITPIARMRDGEFEIDLVLRNNRTTEEYPLGIFHPHEDVHHIKKENIGLIEVMGLAVLPARLQTELKSVEAYLVDGANEVPAYHKSWADELKQHYQKILTRETVADIVEKEVGKKFLRVLEDAGVFKRDEAGLTAFKRFTKFLASN